MPRSQLLRKRKRSSSEPPLATTTSAAAASARAPSPLTADNLALLEEDMARQPPLKRGSKSSDSSSRSVDPALRLSCFEINILHRVELPQPLAELVARLRDTPRREPSPPCPNAAHVELSPPSPYAARGEPSPPSPNAAHVVAAQPKAALGSELNGIRDLEPWLFFKNYLHTAPDAHPAPQLCVYSQPQLDKVYLPTESATNAALVQQLTLPPEQARPDTMIGYMKHLDAVAAHVTPALSKTEELLSESFAVCTDTSYPCFTCQWKSAAKDGTHRQARLQGARDGATVVSFLHYFFASIWPEKDPSAVDTCHFSATCDMESVHFYVHWRNQPAGGLVSFEMETVLVCYLGDEQAVTQARRFMRNLMDHALGERLQRIQSALQELGRQPLPRLSRPKPPVPSFASTTPQSSSMPPTPDLVPSHGTKRLRQEIE